MGNIFLSTSLGCFLRRRRDRDWRLVGGNSNWQEI